MMRHHPHGSTKTRRLLRALVLTVSFLAATASSAQTQTVEGHPMPLPDGRLVIFGPAEEGFAVLRIFGEAPGGATDIADGDLILRVQGNPVRDLATFRAALGRVASSEPLRLEVRRGTEIKQVTLARSAGSSFRIPPEALGRGRQGAAQGWVQGEGTSGGARPPVEPGEQIDSLLVSAVAGDGPGMSVAVWHDGEVVYQGARGIADLEHGAPLTEDTRLPLASVAKPFTAYAVATLIQQKTLELDRDIRTLLPELKSLEKPVTLEHLVGHQSGIQDYTGLLGLTGWDYGDRLTPGELLTLAGRQRHLQFEPGSEHRYSNTNYALMAWIVQRSAGTGFPDWMKQHVFTPLGMKSTVIPASEGQLVARSTRLYRPIEAGYERAFGSHGMFGASGMLGTAADLVRFADALLDGHSGSDGPARDAIAARMRRPLKLDDGSDSSYGFGLGHGDLRGVPRLSHAGSGPGSASVLQFYPEDRLAVAVLANYGGAEVSKLADEIATLLLGDRVGPATGRKASFGPPGAFMITDEHIRGDGIEEGEPLAPGVAEAFAGRYRLDDDREMTLLAEEGVLSLKLLDHVPAVPLKHLGGQRFVFPPSRWELTLRSTPQSGRSIVVHLVEGSIHPGDPRDIPGYPMEVKDLAKAELRRLVGQYLSPELGVAYRVLERDGELYLEHPLLGSLPLEHYTELTFGVAGRKLNRIWFEREDPADPSSPVVALIAEAGAWGATARFDRL
ncbi:hypothetical protein ABI59_20855 [Acidobacteria bacterium Mor1]|nr:hypothetical protein ABI59_20855 [Acidobacteria bacterium Mor1]